MLEIAGRYEVLRRIGAGGMGVVYEAEDKERGQKVALKTITNPDVEKVYQLKREFRVLADLSHPNLVALYDLVVDDGKCFFTMELLDGVDLTTYLWEQRSAAEKELAHAHTFKTPDPRALAAGTHPRITVGVDDATESSSPKTTPCNIPRLRIVLPQLARGLHALHAAGKIHRDIKPSNVRVTGDDRAVLLDFGLVAELEKRAQSSEAGLIVGTVAFMAPEQCAGDVPLTPAADWYALGVVLFHALTGRFPFEGAPARVLLEKQTKAAMRPSRYAREVPADLDDLCAELLEREPGDRPSGWALLSRLGVSDSARMSTQSISISREGGFAGREAEMAALEGALEPLSRKRASVAVVRAPSGLGKSTLVSRFLDRVRASHEDALILRGRCLEREDVPYKAIDPLIDELSDWWLDLPPKEAQAILPRDAFLLPTLFPVLDRVPAIVDAPRTRQVVDVQARRTHAFDALREALQRMGDRRTVVLFLDDMQWVDGDTTALLTDLMRAPDPPPVLLVLATRADGGDAVLEIVRRMDAEPTIVDLAPLGEAAAVAIATAQLGEDNSEAVRRLVAEAEGSPLFLIELTRYLQGRSLDDIEGKGLDAMLAEKIGDLGESGRLLAEVVAVAGEPITRRTLQAASAVPAADLSRQLQHLRAQRVVKTTGSRGDDVVEPYHDRIRVAISKAVTHERRAKHHRAIATALGGKGSPDQLARHWHGAGELEHAAGHAKRAGDEARARLDFDLSARWYAMALESKDWSDGERRELRTLHADALADAGRPREAADVFLAASEGADRATAIELRRRAAGSLLGSGYLREGLQLTRDVLASVGLKMPKTPMRALISMLTKRAWLRIRGLGFKERALSEISQAELTRVDLCENVSFGLVFVNSFRSMDFGMRFLLAALRLGERWRVARALALETDFLAATNQKARALRLFDRLEELSKTIEEPLAISQMIVTRAMVEFFLNNRFVKAYDLFTEAVAYYRSVVGRASFELDTVLIFQCWGLYYGGELAELARKVPAMAEEAARSGSRYTALTLRCSFPLAWLARLEPDVVEANVDQALASWSNPDESYQVQHLFALCSRIDLALYRGRPESVTDRIEHDVPPLRRALLDRPPVQALLFRQTLARHQIALAAAAAPGSSARKQALAAARKHVKGFHKGLPLMQGVAHTIDGCVAELSEQPEAAIAAYRRALPFYDDCEVHVYGHAVRDRLGRLIGGDEGGAMRTGANDWLVREGVRDPARTLAMLAPLGDR